MSASKYFWRPIDLVGCHLLGKRFVGGFSIPEVLRTGEELKSLGYRVSYNLLGEHVGYRGVVFKTTETILNLMGAMNSENRGNVVIKPTQCGLEISPDLFYEEAEEIVRRGREIGIETEFDAEHSRYVADAFKEILNRKSIFAKRVITRFSQKHCSTCRKHITYSKLR